MFKILESSNSDPTLPCLWPNYTFENDCTIYDLDTMESSDSQYPGRIELIKLTFQKGLGNSDTGIYFTSGTIDVTYNNWSGTITYDSNPSTPPTYTLSDGGNTLNDIFSEKSIKAQILSNVSKGINAIRKNFKR